MQHDESWLARVSDHEATRSLGTSHAATTYAVAQVAMAYAEHMQRWRSIDEQPDNGQTCVFIPWYIDDTPLPEVGDYISSEGHFLCITGSTFPLIETDGWMPILIPESKYTKEP